MKQVLIRSGKAVVEEVPAPLAGPGEILVAVAASCVSVGTEASSLALSGMPLYRRALKQPQHVKRVLDIAREQGVRTAIERVRGKIEGGQPTGYSAAGTVVAVGDQVEGFQVGDRVACAGASIANHAQFIAVPVNLAARIPDSVDVADACTVTLGAIALQGVRRAAPSLGETIAVIGLGVLGLMTVQMLKAAGARVGGIDPDPRRRAVAAELGAAFVLDPADDVAGAIARRTDGFGADAAIICAASPSDAIVAQAAQSCRKKGRVVLVGDVGLKLDRADFYAKELDFLISCSYGPGRYDPVFEQGGRDYPLPYVRWTETRNMEAYLALLADGAVRLAPLAPVSFPIEQAPVAYGALTDGADRPLLVLLTYPDQAAPERRVATRAARPGRDGAIGVGILGAGSFLQAVHIPNMLAMPERFRMVGVMNRTGASAKAVADRVGAAYAATDADAILGDPAVGLVVIGTRHDLHGPLVLAALRAGKAVLVEKPLCLTGAELDAIEDFIRAHPDGPLLLTGFNRRFSPAVRRLNEILAGRSTPIMANYRMNAGFLAADHWTQGPEGGGRNLGEACHVYDLFCVLTGSLAVKIEAQAIRAGAKHWRADDNFVATLSFADGSVCSLTYSALGAKDHPKERLEVFADGMVASLDDYRSLTLAGTRAKGWAGNQDKGHKALMAALAKGLADGVWPISVEQQVAATRAALAVQALIA
ncbi:bi-domain-containing oxidoreductase [Magnetospirillum moscoviense]|uniref:Oxidoreductase n=1 Tax=Magnetospirillum moscoviense TaxID=1437059 RepID=A0A178MWU9_9PROT|nr:bi-domain-containing oxidoreductase [Magnetospirillum moscoviense]OAN55109.1 oxidoreductase [Magnetospirillum moscoviense]